MDFRLKDDVKVGGLRPEILLALMVAKDVYGQAGFECVVTSGLEGEHKRRSYHHLGLGIDLRIFHIPSDHARAIADRIREYLTDEYTVLLESDHIHIHYAP